MSELTKKTASFGFVMTEILGGSLLKNKGNANYLYS
jgi:hypothetical protein